MSVRRVLKCALVVISFSTLSARKNPHESVPGVERTGGF